MAAALVRLVDQFDPPERRATVATATCCCCCCCCCVVSMVGTTTFTAINLPASAKAHGQQSATGRAVGAGFALCIFLPVIGIPLSLALLTGNNATGTGGIVLFCLIALLILGGILSALYSSTGEKHPVIAGSAIAAVGAAVSVGEGLFVIWGLFTSAGGLFVLIVYVILLAGGVAIAVNLGDRVRWPRY
ncbi:MAG TPA: hypothetical protein VFL29_08140 [Candidatus Dormibacteraeota bacterium]|nr:hypothetical protein [Candidatus Dormibacteraeota bacterium]